MLNKISQAQKDKPSLESRSKVMMILIKGHECKSVTVREDHWERGRREGKDT
jgi:hypothetical protein